MFLKGQQPGAQQMRGYPAHAAAVGGFVANGAIARPHKDLGFWAYRSPAAGMHRAYRWIDAQGVNAQGCGQVQWSRTSCDESVGSCQKGHQFAKRQPAGEIGDKRMIAKQ